MNAQTVTIISGVLLFGVFALAGWILRRRRGRQRAPSQAEQTAPNDR